MKKGMIVILAVLLLLYPAGCGGKENGPAWEEPEESVGGVDETVRYAVGDMILADGSVVSVEDLTLIDSENLPVAVVAGSRADGAILGVGVHRSASPLPWAADGTVGYANKFTDLICVQDAGGSGAAAFTGDTDGSGDWDVICSLDPQGTGNAGENYPAFAFANTYGETCKLSGIYASGWYIPSIAELYTIYENRDKINLSLQTIYALDDSAAMNGLGTNWYWASSQSDSDDDYAWFVHYFNGYAACCPKNFTNLHALVVRAFEGV